MDRLLSTSVERQNPCRLSSTIVKGTDVLSEGPPEQPPNGLRPSPMLFEGPINSQRPFESAGFTILRTTIRVCAALRLGEQEQASDRGREEQTCSPLGRTNDACCLPAQRHRERRISPLGRWMADHGLCEVGSDRMGIYTNYVAGALRLEPHSAVCPRFLRVGVGRPDCDPCGGTRSLRAAPAPSWR